MELLDRIEATRFLGSEFLLWLWFKSEVFDGELRTTEGRPILIWIDGVLEMHAPGDSSERLAIRGLAPSSSKEARTALLEGKVVAGARVRLEHEERVFQFTYDCATHGLRGVKIPAVLTRDEDEPFYERMALVEELEQLLQQLFQEFLQLRLEPVWEAKVLQIMNNWFASVGIFTPDDYAELSRAASGRKGLSKPARKPRRKQSQ